MMNKNFTMIDPKQIAKKGYKGCKTTTSVMNFYKKNHVDCTWWKPSGSSQKVLMIEWNSFRNTYKQCQKATAQKTTSKNKKSTTRSMAKASSKVVGRIGAHSKKSSRSTWTTKSKPRARRAA